MFVLALSLYNTWNRGVFLLCKITNLLIYRYKYGNRHFWCRGYYVDTVGKNAKKIQEYIQNQLKEDLEYDQMTLKEYVDPFTGEPVKQNK